MENLPLETFQLVCSYCSLYTLAHLRLVSKSFLNKVDGSLNARRRQLGIVHGKKRSASAAAHKSLVELKDPLKAGYITLALGKGRVPMEIAFNGYNPKYNYLEFIQKSPPVIVSVPQTTAAVTPATQGINLSETSNPMAQYAISELRRQEDLEPTTLGKLVLHSWEQDKRDRDANPLALDASTVATSSLTGASSAARPRRGSIGQAYAQQKAEAKEDQANDASYMGRLSRAFWGATNLSGVDGGSSSSSSNSAGASNAVGSAITGHPTPDSLIQAAQSRFYANDPELSPQDRQYKFDLRPGEHYLGDSDFMMKYTVGKPIDSERLFEVDYIRVSWKWILSGIGPIPGTGRTSSPLPSNASPPAADIYTSASSSPSAASSTTTPPSINKRLGGIYTERVQRVIDEVKKQGVSKVIRGELALQGYGEQMLPRDFLSVNLRAEPVLAWIMRMDQDRLSGDRDDWLEAETNDEDDEEVVMIVKENDKVFDVLQKSEQDKDQQALEKMVEEMKDNLGYLTCRCILEEMLVGKGLSRSLVWSVGRVRRGLMDPVRSLAAAQDLLRILEATHQQRVQHQQQQ
ncbi:hypothetical protein DFQ27_000127 [Actinomortierella ambigua]|uniref:F-box domain-containing protein n=1 Tax=Actinomortierella ambigua TaxID=1343610 RepID=A0A9P6QFS4_9FUNG|nr:hypothetical protein DFQ27_000127 [Actinomortierella ambigua]